jgi:hypothetical protein
MKQTTRKQQQTTQTIHVCTLVLDHSLKIENCELKIGVTGGNDQ